MDPNTALAELRSLVRVINSDIDDDTVAIMATDLVNVVSGLDDWLSKGGFLPDDWKKAER